MILHPSKSTQRGFSLFELIIVMVVMVGLAAMVAGAMGPVKKTVARQKAKGQIRMLESGLSGFHSDYGTYPINEDINQGGHVLYKTLFGDYDGDGEPDQLSDSTSRDNKDVHTYVYELQPPKLDENGEPIGTNNMVRLVNDVDYHVVDPWGNSYLYMCYRKTSEHPLGGGLHNPTYDLWSFGEDDGTGSAEQREAKWIRNW